MRHAMQSHATHNTQYRFMSSLPFTCTRNPTASSYSTRTNVASICFTLGSANLTLFRYSTGCRVCSGFPSKYTVSNFSLSPSCFSTSSKLDILHQLAHNSSRLVRNSRPVRESIGFAEMSITRREVLDERPESEVRALWEMWSSSRLVRAERPSMVRRRFAWMERIVRLASLSRPLALISTSIIDSIRWCAYLELGDLILPQPQFLQIRQRIKTLYLPYTIPTQLQILQLIQTL
jgi:hypothetical protein